MIEKLTFRKSKKGSAAIEMAIIAPLVFLIFFSVIEFGLIFYCQTLVELASSRTSRAIEQGGYINADQVRQTIADESSGLISSSSIIVTTDLLTDYKALTVPEPCYSPSPVPVGTCPNGAPYGDTNNNGHYDGNFPELALGGSGDIVAIKVVYPWKIMTPLIGLFFPNGEFAITSTTMVKNEVF